MKYFLYARKSSEDEERQVMSIEAQLVELGAFARKENITVAEKFVESKSAKTPGRDVFNQMVQKIHESKEPVGIIAWHPDRLARNSVDGGQIIYLIDTKKIVALKFPTFWFEPTPQGLFMLQVAFGQSKYYSDNLSENVKRGIRQKLRKGEWPGRAPFGYSNNLKVHTIEPDPVKAKIVKKAFELFASGDYHLGALADKLYEWGVVSVNNKPIGKSTVHRMLSNKIYLGIIVRNGESYVGSHEPLVSQELFDTAQTMLAKRSQGKKRRRKHAFPFLGLFRCGECGGAITAQHAMGHGGLYRYYRCTKKFGPCKQGYVQDKDLLEQIRARVRHVAISDHWKNNMLARVAQWEQEKEDNAKQQRERLETAIKDTDEKLDKLVNALLDGTLDKETYLAKKNELVQSKTDLQGRKSVFDRQGVRWIEPLREWILDAHHAAKRASSDDLSALKSFAEKIGTNHRLADRKIAWDWENPWKIAAEKSQSFIWQGH